MISAAGSLPLSPWPLYALLVPHPNFFLSGAQLNGNPFTLPHPSVSSRLLLRRRQDSSYFLVIPCTELFSSYSFPLITQAVLMIREPLGIWICLLSVRKIKFFFGPFQLEIQNNNFTSFYFPPEVTFNPEVISEPEMLPRGLQFPLIFLFPVIAIISKGNQMRKNSIVLHYLPELKRIYYVLPSLKGP